MLKEQGLKAQNTICYHCGEACYEDICIHEKAFCCEGCKIVYEILEQNTLCEYYNLSSHPGVTLRKKERKAEFEYLDEAKIKNSLLEFSDGQLETVSFYIPSIHCSSCIWLLENLHRLDNGVILSRVNFINKTAQIKYSTASTSLRKIVELLANIGYEPEISLEKVETKVNDKVSKSLYYKVGIAGFCFSNIMLLSFPEYLSSESLYDIQLKTLFGILNIILALPVVLYSASDYYVNGFKAIRHKMITLDLPIFFGISVIFIRSIYEVTTGTGAGYFDSLTGLIFFLLIGRVFQNKTYTTLNFERKYRSYFPLAVKIKKGKEEKITAIQDLEPGNRIVVRNNEIVPADSYLFKGEAQIDYSFVTGESKPVHKVLGEIIYAGGRQKGPAIELEVYRKVSQSYLTGLWNNESLNKNEVSIYTKLSDSVAKYFILFIIISSIFTLGFWYFTDASKAFNAFVSVLIVACPCALALSLPFTLGNIMRAFGKKSLYLKNANVIEKLASIDTIVFDKTGTITQANENAVKYSGRSLTNEELSAVRLLAMSSTHPLSISLSNFIQEKAAGKVEGFEEISGAGIRGVVNGHEIKLGSAAFAYAPRVYNKPYRPAVYISIDNKVAGCFTFTNAYREGMAELIHSLKKNYKLYVLSGDNEAERENLTKMFGGKDNIFFNQGPEDKLRFIKLLNAQGKKVLMLGDGLNDAGALKESTAGIAVTEDINNFFPASDALIAASSLNGLNKYLDISKKGMSIVLMSFLISFVYNAAGLSIAFMGNLSPLLAAILMPLSSITVVLISVGTSSFVLKRKGLL